MIALISSLLFASISQSADVPRTTCRITLRSWCIVGGDGRISMDETAAHDRQWAYHPRWLPDTWSDQIQPLRISESSGCTAQIDIIPILTNDATEGSERIRNYHLFEGCSLEFRWPVGSKDVERTYEQFVERNIMLGHSPDTMRPISRFHRSDGN